MKLSRSNLCWMVALCAAVGGPAAMAARPLPHLRPAVPATKPAPAIEKPNLQVGQMSLAWCKDVGAYCGTFNRPFDPTGTVPGEIAIYFEYYPHRNAKVPSEGMLVAVEGGPGYPSTGSRSLYTALYGPLMNERDLVMMDNRGTGRSQVIDCRLQYAPALTILNIADCGFGLGETAPLYSGLYAADDLAALLARLGAPKIDLYGDSYGTYFSQTFAYHHPQWLRSIVLDSAYPVPQVGGESPWYPTYAPATRDKFNLVCARSPGCRDLPGSSIDHIQPALDLLRSAPFEAEAADADGRLWHFTADASMLADVMMAASPPYATARETDAAARAFVDGDRAPLLRLMAETISTSDTRNVGLPYFSSGAYIAVNCQDVAQVYDMTLPVPRRMRQRDALVAQKERDQPDLYAPFTISEFRAMPLDYSIVDACVAWPAPGPQHPPGPYVPPHPQMPDVPVLVLAGELDVITTPAEGRIVASLFPQSEYVLVANSFHVAVGPSMFDPCAAGITRNFIKTLSAGDTGCAAKVTALRTTPRFAHHIDELPAAEALPGNAASERDLRAVFAAVQTLGDAAARTESNGTGTGYGLRGGQFGIAFKGSRVQLTFDQTRWTDDLAISGVLDWRTARGPAHAQLSVSGPDGITGQLDVRWTELQPEATALITGTLSGRAVVARMPAP